MSNTSSILVKNRNIGQQCKYWSKIEILTYWSKIETLVKTRNIVSNSCSNIKSRKSLVKNRNISQKKIEIFPKKNRNISQESDFWVKFRCLREILREPKREIFELCLPQFPFRSTLPTVATIFHFQYDLQLRQARPV